VNETLPTAADREPSPETGAAARLIVCERTGRWAVALRRELADAGVRVHEARAVADAWQMLAESPGSFLVVELTAANAEGLLRRLTRLERDFPLTRVAVVADRALAAYEWLLREAGAVHFTCSPRRLRPLAEAACRHLAQVPAPQQSLGERIWATLPWKE
jgi:ActR/RegA family two-component response regulator